MNLLNNNNINTNYQQKYTHLSLNERKLIQTYYNQGKSYQFIATKLGRSKSTICYEIKKYSKRNLPSIHTRNNNVPRLRYIAARANSLAKDNQYFKKLSNSYKTIISLINSHIQNHLSLNQVLLIIKKQFTDLKFPSLKTIYNWFHKGLVFYPNSFKSLKSYSSKIKPNSLFKKSIHSRSFKLNDYSSPGHYEIDTIYDGSKKGGVLTFNHRHTMRLYACIIPNRKPSTINKYLRKIIKSIGPNNILSITSDNGVEFSYNKVIELSFNLDWFFADPYCSGQRGQNERLNRDIRLFFPKGTYFKNINKDFFNECIDKINNIPRVKFNGLSALEKSLEIK